ncbi:hypothetical protein BH23GEM8_BH23GEM8_08320 [soil metagenome]
MKTAQDRSFYSIGYAIALLLVVLPLLEFALTIWPLRPSVLLWRFGSFGLLTQAMMLPTLGAFLALVVARHLEQRRVQLVLGVAASFVALLHLGGLGMFMLDSLQARSLARPDLALQVTVTMFRALVAATVYAGIWVWIAVATLRSVPPLPKRSRSVPSDNLVHAASRP